MEGNMSVKDEEPWIEIVEVHVKWMGKATGFRVLLLGHDESEYVKYQHTCTGVLARMLPHISSSRVVVPIVPPEGAPDDIVFDLLTKVSKSTPD